MNTLEQKIIEKSYQLLDLPQSRFKHFTFLTRRNKILSIGWNFSAKTHPQSKRWNFKFETLHSELSMLNSSRVWQEEYHRLSIYNTRILNTGEIALAMPCINCKEMLRYFNFRNIFYTNSDGVFERMAA